MRRTAGCISLLFMVGAIPTALLGFLLHHNSSSSGRGGVGSGLAGLGSAVGLGLIVVATLAQLVGGAGYVFTTLKDKGVPRL